MKRTSKEEDACQRRSQSNTPHKTPSHLLSTECTECVQRQGRIKSFPITQPVKELHQSTPLGNPRQSALCAILPNDDAYSAHHICIGFHAKVPRLT